jgi:hypothetical protein
MINGNFNEAAETIMNVTQNVYDDAWNIVNEPDLAYYFTITLLICFKRQTLKEIQIMSQTLIYKFFEDYIQYLELLENYSKCRFDIISAEFEKILEKIQYDPLLMNHYYRISNEVKVNILKDILKSSSCVSFEYLSKMLREKDLSKIENWIHNGIIEGYLKVKIDDIDKIVYAQEPKHVDQGINKAIDFSKRTYNNSMNKILNCLSSKFILAGENEMDEMKKYQIDRRGGGGRDVDYLDIIQQNI